MLVQNDFLFLIFIWQKSFWKSTSICEKAVIKIFWILLRLRLISDSSYELFFLRI